MSTVAKKIMMGSVTEAAFDIESSIQFTKTGASMLYKDFSATPTDRKKYTISMWIKNGDSTSYILAGCTGYSSFAHAQLYQNTFYWQEYDYQGAGVEFSKISTASAANFGAPDEWVHLVWNYDSTVPAGKVYANGTEYTGFSDNRNGSQNRLSHVFNVHDGDFTPWSGNDEHQRFYIGNGYEWSNGTVYGLNAKVAEVHCVDGQTLDASNFGHDVGGTWTAKAYTGTHGVNGGHYKMLSGAIGSDSRSSGTANNLTVSGLADSAVSTTDVPPH